MKKKKIKPKAPINHEELFAQQKIELYKQKLSKIWIGFAISESIAGILLAVYIRNLQKIIDEDHFIKVIFIVTFITWYIYRFVSRFNLKNRDDFQQLMTTDFNFVKKFNKSEIIKKFITYLFIAVPAFYACGLSAEILSMLGYKSYGFSKDTHALLLSIPSAIGTLIVSCAGSFCYDKIKKYLF